MAHTVFISSTSEDLKEYRDQAKQAAVNAGFAVSMMEIWSPNGKPSVEACLEKVDGADIVVVLVAHRYGWVPDHPVNTDHKSITWLEYEHALKAKKLVLPFLVGSKHEWGKEHYENYRLVENAELPDKRFNALRRRSSGMRRSSRSSNSSSSVTSRVNLRTQPVYGNRWGTRCASGKWNTLPRRRMSRRPWVTLKSTFHGWKTRRGRFASRG